MLPLELQPVLVAVGGPAGLFWIGHGGVLLEEREQRQLIEMGW